MILPEGMENIEFMQNLSPTYAGLIAMTTQIKECPPGTVLFREREECLYIYFVLRGTVSLEIEASPQKTVVIQTLGRHQDHGQRRRLALDRLDKFEAVHARHPQVGQDHVGDLPADDLQGFLAAGRIHRGQGRVFSQQTAHAVPVHRRIVNHQHRCHDPLLKCRSGFPA